MLWSNQSKFNLFGSDGRSYVRRPPKKKLDRYTKKIVKHGRDSIMVWAICSWHVVGPIRLIEGIMTKEIYRDVLFNVMYPYADDNRPLILARQ
ncbi:hypothetical protein Trydic_g7582 [Trypoxylus dichotomus]